MHRLSALLGMPQHRFASIHVVGTNGKSSVTRMIAALLEAHGLRTGACVSPHPLRWSERVLIGGEGIGEAAFEAAVERTAQAAAVVNRGLEEGEEVTQFELATAAAFVAFAAARVKVAVVEAGLGGRLDATNTIPSGLTVLTSVGLDHTAWLGETELEIAGEKLAVLRDHTALVLGRVSEEVRGLAERIATERGASLIVAPEDPGEGIELRAAGGFQRRNFALARAAAKAFLGELDPDRVASVAAALTIPGRLERVADDPPTYLDAAHNPDGAAALADGLGEIAGDRPIVACLAVLAEKDAGAMIAALAPAVARLVCTKLPDWREMRHMDEFPASRRSQAAEALAAAAEKVGVEAEVVEDFGAAAARGRHLASALGGILVLTGSHYALAPARAALALCEDSAR
jgi:dihydrofolate synthase/folylpolyglutamate synthase